MDALVEERFSESGVRHGVGLLNTVVRCEVSVPRQAEQCAADAVDGQWDTGGRPSLFEDLRERWRRHASSIG